MFPVLVVRIILTWKHRVFKGYQAFFFCIRVIEVIH